jgi:hypothetical protein
MTLVNTETGELLDSAAAERRAERIRLRLDAIADNYQAVLPMIREAIEKRDDLALGYRSVGEYVANRFGGALNNLGIEVRREVVRELTEAGMSTRAIAPVVGVSKDTVQRDFAAVSHETPQAPEPGSTEAQEAADRGDTAPRLTPAPVVGIDGKTYTQRPMRVAQRDTAETYLNLIEMQAAKAAREVKNLTPDQIRRVRPKADLWTVGLRNSVEVLQHLIDSLDPEEQK